MWKRVLVLFLAVTIDAAPSWSAAAFKNFITFGDSYTDESRLRYFGDHDGQPPPPGTYLPESSDTSVGGRVWARYVVQYTGKNVNQKWDPSMTLYNYAVAGAVVSNLQTPRYLPPIHGFFPDVQLYEVPAYLADKKFVNPQTNAGYFQPAINNKNTVAAMFIGTNDLGDNCYFTDSQVPGNTLVSYLNGLYAQLDRIYASGVRYFVLFNLFPIYLAPLYANSTYGGSQPQGYWPDRPANLTAVSSKMLEYVDVVNEAIRVRTPFEVVIKKRYAGAYFANFDVNAWALNVYRNPQKYLNGTLPLSVTENAHSCTNASCTNYTTSASPDSFFWYDSLHPSEQVSRQLAREFVNVLNQKSSYAKYYH